MFRSWCLGGALVLATALSAHADDGYTDETIVTGTRLTDEPFEQPYAFYRFSIDGLDERVGRMALDRMNYGPGVFVQRTAPNQASPFIRGLTGEQTLLMFDGIRLSHAFMRPGPNQYAALVPDLSVESVDVILGSSSTVNGSDGLTGALDFRLAAAGRDVAEGMQTWGKARIDSGNGTSLEAGLDGVSGDLKYSFELGGSNFHDRVGGANFQNHLFGNNLDDERIPNTAYEQYSGGLRFAYEGFPDHFLQFSAGHKTQLDAPRPGGYFENSGRADRVHRFFDPQEFSYVHLKDSWTLDTSVVDRLDTKLWWHRYDESQFRSSRRNLNTPDELIRQREYDNALDAIGLDVQATSFAGRDRAHQLTWGATYIHERTDNAYREFRTPAGVSDLRQLAPHNQADWTNRTTVSDGSTYESSGVFVQDNWQLNDRFSLLLGARYSAYQWSFGNVDGSTQDLTGSIRGLWQSGENHRIFVGLSRGFRAPNLTNLNGLVDRGSSGNPASGNPDLDPEISLTYEAGWKWRAQDNLFELTVFRTDIDDLIQRDFSQTTPITTNVEGAALYGFESRWQFSVALSAQQQLLFLGSVSLLDARRDIPVAGGGTFTDNISRANRLYGNLGLKYEYGTTWSGLIQLRSHAAYDDVARHPSDSDADDVRLTVAGNPDGSLPGFGILDFVVGWSSDDGRRSVKLFVENAADKTYREAGSGVDGVGRNIGITASFAR
ncbi:MAG: TonB-dependent receptor [Pseudomonadota bacterium]